jgi:type I restriction enzyme S subunit
MEMREPSVQNLIGIQRTELGQFPADWSVVSLGEFEPFVTSGSRGWAAYYSDIGSTFLRITNLSRSRIYPSLKDLRYVAVPTNNGEGVRTALRVDDVLISITADIGIVGLVTEDVDLPAYINQHIALVRFSGQNVNSRYVAYFLAGASAQRRIRSTTDAGAKAGMNLAGVRDILVALPPCEDEQRAIAVALTDADALIDSLEQLLAKKRQIKQGAMQELLTGKRRLPGFSGEWSKARLGDLAKIKTGSKNNQDKVEDGAYPFFVRSQTIERIDTFTHDCEAILIPGEGGIGNIFHYVTGRFALHQRVYGITEFSGHLSGRFLFFYMRVYFGAHAMQNSVKATVDSLRLPTFKAFQVAFPPAIHEQIAVVGVLSDLEEEEGALESRLTKARALKQAMAQALLTGRIRLVEPVA